jgi:hypothetical protein
LALLVRREENESMLARLVGRIPEAEPPIRVEDNGVVVPEE